MNMVKTGPDVGVLGWIPHGYHFQPIPPHSYLQYASQHQRRIRMGFVIDQLFRSGNFPPPKQGWQDAEQFKEYRWLREFRGMLCLYNVVLEKTDGKLNVTYDYVDDDYFGYTPIRLGPNITYFRGNGFMKSPQHIYFTDSVRIDFAIHYRVGGFWDRVGGFLVGHRAPYAWCSCTYELHIDGRYEITFSGSVVPNQSCWVAWKQEHEWQMARATQHEVKDFVQMGGGLVANSFQQPLVVTGRI